MIPLTQVCDRISFAINSETKWFRPLWLKLWGNYSHMLNIKNAPAMFGKCLCIPRDWRTLSQKFSPPDWSSSLRQLPSVNMSWTSWQAGNNQWSWEKIISIPSLISTGAPQGWVLAPLLFCLYTKYCTSRNFPEGYRQHSSLVSGNMQWVRHVMNQGNM